MIHFHGGCEDFGGTGSSPIDQNRNWALPGDFGRFSGESLRGNRLAAKRGDRSIRKEQSGRSDSFRSRSAPAIAQVENNLMSALLFRVGNAGAQFFRAAGFK